LQQIFLPWILEASAVDECVSSSSLQVPGGQCSRPCLLAVSLNLNWGQRTSCRKRNRGRITAYSTLCKLFTRRTYKPHHIDLISHFYRAIQLVRFARCPSELFLWCLRWLLL
jgi:hypothetical protein